MSDFENKLRELESGLKAPSELPQVSEGQRHYLLRRLLKDVSRAFYLALRVLPARLREPVGLAYLLARAADTVADTEALPPQSRLKHLLNFRRQIEGPATGYAIEQIQKELTGRLKHEGEKALLRALPAAFAVLEALPEDDRERVRDIVVTLSKGMEMDLDTFPSEDSGVTVALKSDDELDSYTYYVAGCVGEFWTRELMAHTPSLAHWDLDEMCDLGVRFGKALQLTNVLRDLPRDLRISRCYLPKPDLKAHGLQIDDLKDAGNAARARPILVKWLRIALAHFEAAERYVLALPRHEIRLRMAVIPQVIIGLATLEKLARTPDWLDPARRVKITRGAVYRTLLRGGLSVCSNGLTRSWMAGWRRRVAQAIETPPG